MTISQKGLVKEAMNQFATDDPLPPAVVNRMQEDDALLSQGQVDLFTSRNKPKIHTGDYKMNVTAGADTVTLSAGVVFDVGGVIFSTDDLVDRAFNIPDGTTKYLYAAVADDCGEAVDWQADPIVRNRTVSMTLEDALVESTPTKMLILKAVKGSAGETPAVTLYANEGAPLTGVGGGGPGNYIYDLLRATYYDLAYIGATNPEQYVALASGAGHGGMVTLPIDGDRLAQLEDGNNMALWLHAGVIDQTSGTEIDIELTLRLDSPGGANTITKTATLLVADLETDSAEWVDTGITITSTDVGGAEGDLTGEWGRVAATSEADGTLVIRAAKGSRLVVTEAA